jgi:hypothetical protein
MGLLCSRPATAVAWYSPGSTRCREPAQPGDEVRRSQETRRTAGVSPLSTTGLEPAPLTQSAELQTLRSLWATTTATNLVPMLNRHGWLWLDTARTVNRGLLPDWYQPCGDEMLSVMPPRAQAGAVPEAWDLVVFRCRAGVASGEGEGEGAGLSLSVLTCGAVEFALPGGPAWPAVELATSRPFTAQLSVVISPAPTARTTTRRRQ